MLQTWVQRQGGGLIYVADRINTFQLIRRGTESGSPLYPILDILPVIPDDVIAVKIQSIARTPRRLYLNPIPGSDLLKIDDPPVDAKTDGMPPPAGQPQSDPIAGWEDFFTDRDKYVKSPDDKVEFFPSRGFFSCYPVKDVKPGAHVLAEFAVLDDRGEKVLRPWLVTNNPSAAWRTALHGLGRNLSHVLPRQGVLRALLGQADEVHGRQAQREGDARPRARQQGIHLRHAHSRAGPGAEPDLEALPAGRRRARSTPSSTSGPPGPASESSSPGPSR